MSLRPTLQTACRALALRSRPLAQRQEPLVWAATKRGYSDELRKGERSQIPVLKKTENAAFPQGQEVPESAPGQQQVWISDARRRNKTWTNGMVRMREC